MYANAKNLRIFMKRPIWKFPIGRWIDGCLLLNIFLNGRLVATNRSVLAVEARAIVVSTNVCSINLCGPDKLTAISRGLSSWKLLIALVARLPPCKPLGTRGIRVFLVNR